MMVHQPTTLCGYAKVEITVIASKLPIVGANSTHSTRFQLPDTDSVSSGSRVFLSGEVVVMPGSGMDAQLTQVLNRLESSLKLQGLTKNHVVETRAVLKDIQDLDTF